jgi:hypothetical protein
MLERSALTSQISGAKYRRPGTLATALAAPVYCSHPTSQRLKQHLWARIKWVRTSDQCHRRRNGQGTRIGAILVSDGPDDRSVIENAVRASEIDCREVELLELVCFDGRRSAQPNDGMASIDEQLHCEVARQSQAEAASPEVMRTGWQWMECE